MQTVSSREPSDRRGAEKRPFTKTPSASSNEATFDGARRLSNTSVQRVARGDPSVLRVLLAARAGWGNRAIQRLVNNQPGRHTAVETTVVQRQGGYIPDIDGPYGHVWSDGASTAGAAFSAQTKRDVLEQNANHPIPAEQLDLVHISDEDQDTMLTRERTAVAEVDHIYPRGLGGSSSHRNAAVVSADSNTFHSNTYPKEFVESYDGTRVLMGHGAVAQGFTSPTTQIQFYVPPYQDFEVHGSGAAAQIDMSDYQYSVTVQDTTTGQIQAGVPMQGPNDLSPAAARNFGILPAGIPDPR
jgi:hypothetical protein